MIPLCRLWFFRNIWKNIAFILRHFCNLPWIYFCNHHEITEIFGAKDEIQAWRLLCSGNAKARSVDQMKVVIMTHSFHCNSEELLSDLSSGSDERYRYRCGSSRNPLQDAWMNAFDHISLYIICHIQYEYRYMCWQNSDRLLTLRSRSISRVLSE